MITREKVCVSCPSEMGCAGNRCLQGYVTHWFCDNCGMEFSKYQLRRVDERGVLPWDGTRVNTEIAYEAWGLDITKLEYRLGKLKALGVRS